MPEELPSTFRYDPFSQVPNEIIAKVFLESTKQWRHDLCHHRNSTPVLPFPDLVSAVCTYWRALSHGTPELWTFIRPLSTVNCLDWISKWLQRSKSAPIEVLLDQADLVEICFPEVLSDVLTLLDGCAHRLYRFDISVHVIPIDIIPQISRLVSKATRLQQLSLSHWLGQPSTFDTTSDGSRSSWLQQRASLKRLRFDGISLPFSTHITTLDVNNLTLTYSDLPVIFGAECRLTYLILRNLQPLLHPAPERQQSSIRVESLCYVAIKIFQPSINAINPVYLFSFLDLPKVTYLELDCTVTLSSIFGNSLRSAKVDTLKLFNNFPVLLPNHTSENNKDIRILQSFTNLRRLELAHTISAKWLLDKFSVLSKPPSREVTRQRSIGSHMHEAHRRAPQVDSSPTEPSQLATAWPNIRSVLLDTAIAADVVSLISFIRCHKSICTVELSTPAMRHLTYLDRDGDIITETPFSNLFRFHRSGFLDQNGAAVTRDVKQWLSDKVDLKEISNCDLNTLLRQTGGDPISQLP